MIMRDIRDTVAIRTGSAYIDTLDPGLDCLSFNPCLVRSVLCLIFFDFPSSSGAHSRAYIASRIDTFRGCMKNDSSMPTAFLIKTKA